MSSTILNRLHYVSAGMVSSAPGLNNTPKIAALLLITPVLGGFGSTALVGLAIAVGGVTASWSDMLSSLLRTC
ncbi:MAG: hypothetical protein IH991_17080 [Planctomycetes bacterium]|nr:hypothetical protein [Planctomycetota bacterium]